MKANFHSPIHIQLETETCEVPLKSNEWRVGLQMFDRHFLVPQIVFICIYTKSMY